MATISMVNAADQENAIILIDEGKRQFANKDYAAARASFKEAAGFDPENRQVWLYLASVSAGDEQAAYRKRANRNSSTGVGAVSSGARVPAVRRRNRLVWILPACALTLGVIIGAIWLLWSLVLSQPEAAQQAEPLNKLIPFAAGGRVNFTDQASLFIPAGSLTKDEEFQLGVPSNVPVMPDLNLFQTIGQAYQVETSANMLRQPIQIGIRYDPSKLPPDATEQSLQLAMWDGSNWKIVDHEINLDLHVIYTSIYHFSAPIFRLVVWSPKIATTAMLKFMDNANRIYFEGSHLDTAANLYKQVVEMVPSVSQLAQLSETDQQMYWMAYNLWGDALYNSQQYDQAGQVYLDSVQKALQSGLKITWGDHFLTSPGYALDSLQNRYPMGVALTQTLRTQNWAAHIPASLLTLAAEQFTWESDTTIDKQDLPPAILKTINDNENTLAQKPGDAALTYLNVLVLSPQSQTSGAKADLVKQVIVPFLQSSGVQDITSAALKDETSELQTKVEALLNQNLPSNSYRVDPVQPGEDSHTQSPLILLRVERIWSNPSGLTHSQYVFTIRQSSAELGKVVGDPIVNDTTLSLANGVISQAQAPASWIMLGSKLTADVKITPSFTDQSLAVGSAHACALTRLFGVQCWGKNQSGQLGNGDTKDSPVPVDVVGLTSGIKQLVAGDAHSCALTNDHKLYCWGDNSSGQLGDNSGKAFQSKPVLVPGINGEVISLTAGTQHTCALTKDGSVYCWGNSLNGRLGISNSTTANAPIPTPIQVPGLTGVKSIAAGAAHTCAVLNNGTVKCWGSNSNGQLGDGSRNSSLSPVLVSGLSEVTSITAGQEHTCALTSGEGVKCWGFNRPGQVGSGAPDAFIPLPADVMGLQSSVQSIKTLKNHTCAITLTGISCWGANNAGQLGNDTLVNQPTPVEVKITGSTFVSVGTGSDFTCANTVNGLVYCWGANTNGQLGNRTLISSGDPQTVSGFGTSVVDATGKMEVSPITNGDIELGTTVFIKGINLPADTTVVSYLMSFDGKPFSELEKTPGSVDVKGKWNSTGSTLGKKVIFKIVTTDKQGTKTEYVSREMAIVDTLKPTARIVITPPDKVIELGSSVSFAAQDVNDAVRGVVGSGVSDLVFSVLENGDKIFTTTLAYSPDKPMQVTWPVPFSKKNNQTLVSFSLKVVDKAGKEAEFTEDGYSLVDHLPPSFIGSLKVEGDQLTGDKIEMGSKASVTVNVSDQYQGGKQGSGIKIIQFFVSVGEGVFKPLSSQTFSDGTTLKTIKSEVWDSTGHKQAGEKIRFAAQVVDYAGNKSELKVSGNYWMNDSTPPKGILTAPKETLAKDPEFSISVTGIDDGTGTGVKSVEFSATCATIAEPLVEPNPGTSLTKKVKISDPSSTCRWGKKITITAVISDGANPVMKTTLTQDVDYMYDNALPTGILLLNNAQTTGGTPPFPPYSVTSTSAVAVNFKVNDDTASGGSPIDWSTETLSVKCGTSSANTINKPTVTTNWTPFTNDICAYGTNVTFTATVKDKGGNLLTETAYAIMQYDDAPPDGFSINSSSSAEGIWSFTASVKDNDGGKGLGNYTLQISNETPITGSFTDNPKTGNINVTWPSSAPSGGIYSKCGLQIPVTLTVLDAAQRSTQATTNVTFNYLKIEGSITAAPASLSQYGTSLDLSAQIFTCAAVDHVEYVISGTDNSGAAHSVVIDSSDSSHNFAATWMPNGPGYPFQNGQNLAVSLTAYGSAGKQIPGTIIKTSAATLSLPNVALNVDEDTTAAVVFPVNPVTALGGAVTWSNEANQGPFHGNVSIGKDTISYTPASNYSGIDTFKMRAQVNANKFLVFPVTVTVKPVNDPPVINAQKINPMLMDEDTSLPITLADLTVNDVDNIYPNGFSLTVQAGTNYNVDAQNTITPVLNYSGPLVVMVRVNDGAANSNWFPLAVSVNAVDDPPVINGQTKLSMLEDDNLTIVFTDLIVADPDKPAYPAGFTLTVQPGTNYTVANNVITPDQDYNGFLNVSVKVNDGTTDSNVYHLTVAVTPVDDPPVITGQTTLSTPKDTDLTITLADLTVKDPDFPAYPTGFNLIVQSGTNYTVSGTTITPDLGYTGPLTVSVKVNDGDADSAAFDLAVTVGP